MPKRPKRAPPRVYHDGLIPTASDTYHTYPEVVPDDHNQIKHEKSYPELAPPPPPSPPPHPPPTAVGTPPTTSHGGDYDHSHYDHNEFQHHHSTQHSIPHQLSSTHLPPSSSGRSARNNNSNSNNPPKLTSGAHHPPHHLPALPRPSGVHSLRQAWSELNDHDGDDGIPFEEKPPVWRRPIFWVVVVALVVIVALAGILGGVASGGIQTAWEDSKGGSSTTPQTPPPPPSVASPVCPGDNNRNYTSSATADAKTFRIQCGANYPGGDGSLGLQSEPVDSIAACLDACSRQAECVAAVFNPGDAAECWLKQSVGVVKTGGDAGGMASGVLWQ